MIYTYLKKQKKTKKQQQTSIRYSREIKTLFSKDLSLVHSNSASYSYYLDHKNYHHSLEHLSMTIYLKWESNCFTGEHYCFTPPCQAHYGKQDKRDYGAGSRIGKSLELLICKVLTLCNSCPLT